MVKKTVMDSNGVSRTIEGKIFGDQLRVYRVYGDVTDIEGLKETAQILALQTNTTEVVFSL
mgnify:CR=1 FL=1|jgi:hypothetical protein